MVKKLVLVLLASAVILTGCSKDQNESTASAPEENLRIGISQFVLHPALDAVYEGIVDEMANLGYTNIEYDYQNSNGDVGTTRQIASLFQNKKMDIVVGIATPNAQALISGVSNAPVVYSAITDPISAGLVKTLEHGDPGVNGTSYKNPFKQQIEFLMNLCPVEALGQVYTGSEDNAMFQAKQVEKACAELGIEYVGMSITSSAEVKSATEAIIKRVDAIYVTNDNTVVSALNGLAQTAIANKVPVLSADTASAKDNPVLIAWGFDWHYIGMETARIMDRILQGEKPEEMPTTIVSDPSKMEMLVNTSVAEKIGIQLPQSVLDQATGILEE